MTDPLRRILNELHPDKEVVQEEIAGSVWVGTPEAIELIKELSKPEGENNGK